MPYRIRKAEDAIQAAGDWWRERCAARGDPFPEWPRTAADCTAWCERNRMDEFMARVTRRVKIARGYDPWRSGWHRITQ